MFKPAHKSKKIAKSRRSGSWKKVAKKRREKAKLRKSLIRYVAIFALFSFSLLSLVTYVSYKKLTNPFVSASSNNSYTITEEDIFSLTLVFVDDFNSDPVEVTKTHFMLVDTRNNKILGYIVPVEETFDVPGRYSLEPLSKILGLGMSLHDGDFNSGVDVFTKTLANFFGYESDKYLVVDSTLHEEFEEFFLDGDLMVAPSLDFINKLEGSVKTNLSLNEIYFLYKFVNSLPSDRIINRELTTSYIEDPDVVDTQLRDLTLDSQVSIERKSIAVLNGSDVPGLANFGSRVVQNFGGRVIAVSNASKKYEQSILIVDDTSSETAKVLARFFKIDDVRLKSDVSYVNESEIDRADIVLIVGVDIVEML